MYFLFDLQHFFDFTKFMKDLETMFLKHLFWGGRATCNMWMLFRSQRGVVFYFCWMKAKWHCLQSTVEYFSKYSHLIPTSSQVKFAIFQLANFQNDQHVSKKNDQHKKNKQSLALKSITGFAFWNIFCLSMIGLLGIIDDIYIYIIFLL